MTTMPTAIRTVRWMVRDTFRQSLSTKLFWVMLGITVLATIFCLGVQIDKDTPPTTHPYDLKLVFTKQQALEIGEEAVKAGGYRVISGEMKLGFGLFTVPEIARNRLDSVRYLQIWFAGILADNAGVLLALLWTAGFLPTFLEPQSVTVLLAKPVPRWALLVGKYLGVVLFVALQATLFVAGTWLALGISTGVWHAAYWAAVPILIVHFAVFYAFSAFLAVCTRSTVVAALGTLLFWFLCWVTNTVHHQLAAVPQENLSPAAGFLLDAGYWCLPKPLDFNGLFFEAMDAATFSMPVPEFQAFQVHGHFQPELSVLSCLAFAAVTLAIAANEFRKMDY